MLFIMAHLYKHVCPHNYIYATVLITVWDEQPRVNNKTTERTLKQK